VTNARTPVSAAVERLQRWIKAPRNLVDATAGEPVQSMDDLNFRDADDRLIARYLVVDVDERTATLVRMDGSTWGEA
jgi:hypothetical protein